MQMRTWLVLSVVAALGCGSSSNRSPEPGGSAARPDAPAFRVVSMQAEPGDRLSAGPETVLLDPQTGRAVRHVEAGKAELENGGMVAALRRAPDGSIHPYLIRLQRNRVANPALVAAGSAPVDVVVPDRFDLVEDVRHVRLFANGRETAGPAELVAYTRHDSLFAAPLTGLSGRVNFETRYLDREIGRAEADVLSAGPILVNEVPRTNTTRAGTPVAIRWSRVDGLESQPDRSFVSTWRLDGPGAFESGGRVHARTGRGAELLQPVTILTEPGSSGKITVTGSIRDASTPPVIGKDGTTSVFVPEKIDPSTKLKAILPEPIPGIDPTRIAEIEEVIPVPGGSEVKVRKGSDWTQYLKYLGAIPAVAIPFLLDSGEEEEPTLTIVATADGRIEEMTRPQKFEELLVEANAAGDVK